MTVTYGGEIAGSRTARNTAGRRSYSRSFRLETSLTTESAYVVGSHSSLPVIGSLHPSDANAYCKSLDVRCTDGFKAWQVTAEYDDAFSVDSSTPASDEIKISWNSELFQTPAIRDKDGNAVVNSAGDPFNPPAMKDDSRLVCHIVVSAANVPAYVLTYPNIINSASFTIDGIAIGKRFAKISSVNVSEKERRNGTIYRTVAIEMHIQNKAFDFELMDLGFRRTDPKDDTKRIPCVDDHNHDVTEPAQLDGLGNQVKNPSATTAVFGAFRVYKELAYAGIIPGCT